MAETRQERQQRLSQRDLERQAREDAIKRGLGSFGPQAPWLAGLMAPSSGITDYFGLYPEAPTGQGITGETLPSFGENIQNKQYLDALYQGLGLAGDAMYASTPFTGAVGILGGTALKGMGAVGKASRAGNKMIVHGTTKDTANIIRQEGEITPNIGSFVEDMYIKRGDYKDVDPFDYPPLASFHTSIDDPSGAISAMESQIGYKLGKPYDDISLKEIEEHGSIILSEVEPSLAFKYADDERNIVNLKGERVSIDEPLGFESEDIISFYPVEPSRILEGKDLVAFVKSYDPKWNMQQQELPFGKASKLAKAQNLINQGKATAGTSRATEKLMEPTNIEPGTIVDVRRNLNSKIDDPELERFKVQTIHGVATKGGKATKAESSIGTGPALSYDASVTVRADEAPIELNVNQKARDQIASRTKPKFPMAAVRGEHAPTENFNPDLVLKFNPMKQNVFVDDSGYGVKAIKNGKATIVDNDVMVKLDNPENFRTIKAPDGSDVKIYDDIEYYDNTTLPKTENPSDVNVLPIKAYHGSPHDFEKFDLGKMGSGEGFQAFGRGLYFAEAEDVAKGYQKILSRKEILYDGKPIKIKKGTKDQPRASRELENSTGDREIDEALMFMQEHRMTPDEYLNNMDNASFPDPAISQTWGDVTTAEERARRAKKIRRVKDKITLKGTGKVYETDIYATPDELLDWYKPLSEQPKAVQEKIAKLDPEVSHELMVSQGKVYETSTGEDLYDALESTLGEGTEALDEVGIKGIKYLDGFSRGKQSGTSNYVIFDTRILDIANKYGVAIPVAGAMLLSIDKGEKAIEGGRKDI